VVAKVKTLNILINWPINIKRLGKRAQFIICNPQEKEKIADKPFGMIPIHRYDVFMNVEIEL